MVYCGKPSKACAQCRVKRTKCDMKWPSCSQCLRAGRTCSGYRDPLALMFRNQTEELASKHGPRSQNDLSKAESLKKDGVVGTPINALMAPVSHPCRRPSTSLVHSELFVPLEVQATCFFFQNYILEDFKGYYSYMPSVYGSIPAGCALDEAINSLGMAGIANLKDNRKLMIKANLKYTSALHTINAALRDQYEAKTDQTLVAVMLLGLFETNTCSTPRSMTAWAKHIEGASSLIQLRGRQQLRHRVGHELFLQLRTQVLISCLQRHLPLPESFLNWTTDAIQFGSDEEVAVTTLYTIAAEYCSFRSAMTCFREYSRSAEIVSAVLNIDAKLDTWASTLPSQYAYDIISISEPSEDVFTDHYHLYKSLWIASVWNNYRSIRILVNELLLIHFIRLSQEQKKLFNQEEIFFSYDSEVTRVKSVIIKVTHDVCASVPFFLGYHESQKTPVTIPKRVNGNLLIWPLYVASTMDAASDMMRAWAATRLEKVGQIMGIQQASILAEVLKRGRTITLWDRKEDTESEDW